VIHRLVVCALLPTLVASGTSAARAAGPAAERVVVYDLASDPADAAVARRIGDALLLHLGEQPGITALGESELQVMLGHAQDRESLRACQSDRACLAGLQDAVDARRLVTGRLGRLGETWIVTLKLVDAELATVAGAESAEADDPGALAVAAVAAVDRLLGVGSPGGPARDAFALTIAPDGTAAAVIDLAAFGVAPALARNLTELLTLELKRFEGLSVISKDEIATMLQFAADKHQLGCSDDTSCLIAIGGALGVDYLVTGSVGRLGDSFVITLKLMDVDGARVAHRTSESLRGDEPELALALRYATWGLLGRPVGGRGELTVKANVDSGRLAVGASDPLPYAGGASLPALAAGKYGVTLQADGFYPLYKETYVFDGRATQLRMQLLEEPRAWYEEWWTWAIIGGVVAAGVTTAVLLLPNEPSSGTVRVGIE
jgi:TolB-like protein